MINKLSKPIIQAAMYCDGELYRQCPHCKRLLSLKKFGLRLMGNGIVRNQSWCKDCRSYRQKFKF